MSSKRDILLNRNYYFLRIKQAIYILLCTIVGVFIIIKNQNDLPPEVQWLNLHVPELSYGVAAVIVLIAIISLRTKQWLLFLYCALAVYLNIDDSFPPVSIYARASILATMGILCLLNMELRYVKDNFGLTLFPPGSGTLRPQSVGSTGRFLSLWELARTFKWRPGGIFIGRPLPEQRLFGLFNFVRVGPPDDRHMLTIAGSRGGKGTAAIIPNLLIYPGSVVAVDPKGELAKITAARRGHGSKRVKKSLGQDVFVFDPENNVPGQTGASWNPLAELDLTDPHLWANVDRISNAIVPKSSDLKDAFFTNHARTLLTALIMHTFENELPERHNLIYIRQLIMAGDEELYQQCLQQGRTFANAEEALYEFMAQSTAHGGKIARAAKSLLSTPYETRGSIIGTLREQSDFLEHPGIEQYLQHSDFSLKALKQSPTTIYLCLKSTSLATNLVKILSIFIDLSMVELERDKENEPAHRVLFIIDEFYALGRNEIIDVGMGLFAGLWVILWPVLQNISQLKTHYPNNWQTFITNCRGIQLFNEQELDTKKWLEEQYGTILEKRSDGSFEKVPLLSVNALTEYFRRADRRQIFLPQGSPPAFLELMDYFRFFPKSWYNDLSDNDTPNPNPNPNPAQIITRPSTQPVAYLPSPPPSQLSHSGTATGFTLSLSRNRVYKLNLGMLLSSREIPELNAMSSGIAVAEVCCHPSNPAILGIKNLSDQDWKVCLPNGNFQTVAYGKSIRLDDGCMVSLGPVKGEINLNPFLLKLTDGRVFTLTVGKSISCSEIPELSSASSSGIVGEVCCNPNDPTMLGLKNLSTQNWKAILPDGSEGPIVKNKSLRLSEGTQINFGSVQGEISH